MGVSKDKQYIIEERKRIVKERLDLGYSLADIARMLNVDISVVSRIKSSMDNENEKE